MNNKWISRLEDVMLQLGAVHDAMAKTSLSSNEYNPISGNFTKAKVELFNLYNEIKENTLNELPNLAKSTENLSKIKNKDEWLDEVRGKDSKLEELEKWCDEEIRNCTLNSGIKIFFDAKISAFNQIKSKIKSLKQES